MCTTNGGDNWCMKLFAVRRAPQGNSTKCTMPNSIYDRLSQIFVRANACAFITSEAIGMDLLDGCLYVNVLIIIRK